MSSEKLEFAIRELAITLEHLMQVVDQNKAAYGRLPIPLHRALIALNREIDATNWEAIR